MFDPFQDHPTHPSPRLTADSVLVFLFVCLALLWPHGVARAQQVGLGCAEVVAERTASCFAPVGSPHAPYPYRFTVRNWTPSPVHHLAATAVDPDNFLTPLALDDLEIEGSCSLEPPVAPGDTTDMTTFWIGGPGARPNRDVCLRLSLHDAGLRARCSFVHCVTLPDCSPNPEALRVHGETKVTSVDDGVRLDGFGDDVGGVDLAIPGTDLFTATWAPFDPLDGEGAAITVSTFGLAGDAVGTVRAEGLGGTVDVSVNFHRRRQPGIVVDVLRPDGTVLLSQLARSDQGPVVTLDDWPAGMIAQTHLVGIVLLGPEDTYGIRLADGTRVEGLLRLRPRGMVVSGPFSSAALRVQGLDALHVDALTAAADCDRDRVPDTEAILRGLVADDDGDGVPDRCPLVRFLTLP